MLSEFEVYSRWLPLLIILSEQFIKLVDLSSGCNLACARLSDSIVATY